MLFKKFLLFMIFVSPAISQAAGVDTSSPWYPQNIIQKNGGTIRPEKIADWTVDVKGIPSDWIKVDNKYFTASYPKCVKISGVMEEADDPKNSEEVDFFTDACPGVIKNIEAFAIGHAQQYDWYLKAKTIGQPTLLSEKIKIGDLEAKLFVTAQAVTANPKDSFKLRWDIVTMCKDKGHSHRVSPRS